MHGNVFIVEGDWDARQILPGRIRLLTATLVVSSMVCLCATASPSYVLSSSLMSLELDPGPFSFAVTETSTGGALLVQNSNSFTIGGSAAGVLAATNILQTATTLDADLLLAGSAASGHVRFHFIQPGILQTTLSSSNNSPEAIFQQFADQGEDLFGVLETPYGATLSARGHSWPVLGNLNIAGLEAAANARAPFYLTTRHYGIYAETDTDGTMTLALNGNTGFAFPVAQLTYDILYGPDYATIMAEFNSRTVPPYMPPLWALDSIWWKDDDHVALPAGVANAQGNVLDTASRLILYHIHAGSEWIDRPYGSSCGQGDGGWGNMDFDGSFPNPPQMIASLHAMGYNLMLWISDLCWCNLYNEASANGYLFAGSAYDNATVNLQNPLAYHWFQTNLNAFVNLGIMGYKIDRGEQGEMPDSFQNTNNTLFEQLAYDGLAAAMPGNFYVFARSASDTARQYTAIWNGDSACTFAGLQYSIIAGLRAGMLDFPMWGSDAGGYIGLPSEELFDRWLEFTAYSAAMEVLNGGGRTPWYNYSTNFASPTNIVAICQAQAQTHHDLMPYARSWLYQATQTGMPVMRPIMFGYPDDTNEATTVTNCEYLFGPNLLAAPVITSGAVSRSVYLPADRWLDYNTRSALYAGPATLTAAAPIQSIPVFVKEGAIIPRGDIYQGNNSWTSNWSPRLQIEFYPSDTIGSSCPYFTGATVQNITCTNQNHLLTIQLGDLGLPGNLQIYLQNPGAVLRNGVLLAAGTDYTYSPTQEMLQVPFNGATTLVVSNAASLFTPFAVWQTAYFGSFTNGAAGPSANPSGDGLPNFVKYALGLDPRTAESGAPLLPCVVTNAGANYLALTFQRAAGASNATLTVLVAGDLLRPWLTGSSYAGTNIVAVTTNTTEVSRVASGGLETITVRENAPMSSAPQGLMTLRVTSP